MFPRILAGPGPARASARCGHSSIRILDSRSFRVLRGSCGPPARRGPRPAAVASDPENLTERVKFRGLKGCREVVKELNAAYDVPEATSSAMATTMNTEPY